MDLNQFTSEPSTDVVRKTYDKLNIRNLYYNCMT